jgi:hypothetical protein
MTSSRQYPTSTAPMHPHVRSAIESSRPRTPKPTRPLP